MPINVHNRAQDRRAVFPHRNLKQKLKHKVEKVKNAQTKSRDSGALDPKQRKTISSSEAEAPLQEVNSKQASYLIASVVDIR